MNIINNSNIKDYRDRLERQKKVLQIATAFNDDDKREIEIIYTKLLELCDHRIANKLPTNETIID